MSVFPTDLIRAMATSEVMRRTAIDWTNRGAALAGENRIAEAVDCFRRAVEADPGYLLGHKNLGVCLELMGDLCGAATAFQQVLQIDGASLESHRKLGDLHVMLGEMAIATTHYRQAAQLAPNDARLQQNLGSALGTIGRYEDAIMHFRRAIELEPNCADFYRGLGLALVKTCSYDEAETVLRMAIELEPRSSRAHSNLGQALQCAGRIDEALASYERSIMLDARDPEPRMGRATCLFSKGEYEAGWADYEARSAMGFIRAGHRPPCWKGEQLAGRTLLIETEQGFGDTIQFVRYAAEIKQRHTGEVVLACEPALIPLLATAPGIDRVISQNEPRSRFDCWISLMSVPGVFGHGLGTFRACVPYLSAEPGRVARWKSTLASLPGTKIGLAWQGNPTFPQDRERSIPLGNFLPLQQCPDATMISLQKGLGTEQLAAHPGHRIVTLGDEFDAVGGAFLDTAAVMKNLDLVITSDTSIAHLAGALGVPVWVALPLAPHWRWGLTGENTCWYPTMRLFRQERRGDWDEVFGRIAAELTRFCANQAKEKAE